jgi:Flp pilus assembly protein TadG
MRTHRRSCAKRSGSRADDRGQAMVEFALVLPLLLLLIFGIFDFGRAINYWIDATHMANEAARYAAVGNTPTGCSSIASCVKAQADSPELKNGGTNAVPNAVRVCVTQPTPSTAVGSRITATATFTYNWLPFLGLAATQTTVQASDTMRLENWNGSVVGCSS